MRNGRLVLEGLRFGMLLQLAVGPVCLFALNAAATRGFSEALGFVAAVALVDAFYITLSALGVAAVINRPRIRRLLGWIGGGVLVAFGIQMLWGATYAPAVATPEATGGNLFVQGLALTLSNPLTLLFWSGMLGARMAQAQWNPRQLSCFAAGCVLATVLFLTGVIALGDGVVGRLPPVAIRVLNGAVGVALIGFGLRLALRREQAVQPQ